jgi:hypothetical protein
MIQLIPQLRILLACKPIDFRKGIDGLCAFTEKMARDGSKSWRPPFTESKTYKMPLKRR